ncbi:MAG: hopanoid-associated sugar epimerase [Acidobacteriota bacterium]
MKPVLVTGGSGFVGAHLVRQLLQRGDAVRCLVRPTSARTTLDGLDVELAEGDLRNAGSLREAVRGCGRVFHCAADYRLYARDPNELYDSNVGGTQNVLEAALREGVERVVYTSTVGALGIVPGGVADETTPVTEAEMIGHYKRSKYLAEREAEKYVERGLPVVIVNPSTPVGELDVKPTPTGQIIVDYLSGRLPAYVATGLNLIDVRDVARGHLLADELGRPGRRYILGHRNLTLREMLDLLSRLTGRPPVRLRLPHWIPLSVGAVSTAWARRTGGEPRVSVESVRMSTKTMFFDATRARDELGLSPGPVEEALRRAIDWFCEHHASLRGSGRAG